MKPYLERNPLITLNRQLVIDSIYYEFKFLIHEQRKVLSSKEIMKETVNINKVENQ